MTMSNALSAPLTASAMAFLVSSLLTAGVLNYARRVHLVDQPGYRRSHMLPTPRGGGLAFVVVQLCFVVWAVIQGSPWLGLLLGLGAVAFIGFVDDHHPLTARLRLLVHLLGAGLTLGLLGSPWSSLACVAVAVVWIVAMTNAWNFMDGINGIASVNAMVAFLAYGLVGWIDGRTDVSTLSLIALGATAGFVPFNFPRAQLFMGDVGSGSLGFLLAVNVLLLWNGDVSSVPVLLFPVLGMVADAGLTLAFRVLSGRRWYVAHREHLYQWMVRSGYSHAQVVMAFVGFSLVVALPHMLVAWHIPSLSFPALISAMLIASGLWFGGKRHCLARLRCRPT